MASLADKIRCPHCLEELDYLENPKELPCSHIFCMPCLESITSKIEGVVQTSCSICRATHDVTSLNLLESARVETRTTDLFTTSESLAEQEDDELVISCDKCDKSAVSYCAECDWKLCSNHEELHRLFFIEDTTLHKLISIQSYLTKPNLYIKPRCPTHGKEYAMCCKKCFSLKFQKCTVDSKCAQSADGETDEHEKDAGHYYHTMTDAATQLHAEFKMLLRDCSKKLTDMCKLEKQTWQELDETNEMCDILIEKVNTKSEELVVAVRSAQRLLVEEITSFKTLKNEIVESNLAEIRTQRDTFGKKMIDCEQFVKTNHVVNVVKGRKRRRLALNESMSDFNSHKLVPERAKVDLLLWERSLKHYMNVSIKSTAIPQHLKFLDTIVTDGRCYDAHFLNGSIHLANHDGIRIYPIYNNNFKTIPTDRQVFSVGHYSWNSDRLFFISFAKKADTQTVYRLDTKLPQQVPTELFSFHFKGTTASFIAVSKLMIAAVGLKQLIVFDLKTNNQKIMEMEFQPKRLHFISDKLLLATDNIGRLHLLRLEDCCMKYEIIWSSEILPGIQGVCTSGDGLIVVKSSTVKAIHILSPLGKTLQTLNDDKLQPSWGGISVHGDVLAAACPEQNKFQLFRLY